MFGSALLDVAIGIIFIYLLVSVFCSAVREVIESLLKTRAAYLEHGIRELLHDREATGLARSFFTHPLIYSLYLDEYRPRASAQRPPILARGSTLPTYIPARNFALALMDLAARGPSTDALSSSPASTPISLETIRANVRNLGNEAVQRALLTAIDAAEGDLNRVRQNIEAWFDSSMDRVSGWYKRSTHWIIFVIGFVVAMGMNINSITIADYLYRNDAEREALVARAQLAAADSSVVEMDYAGARAALDSLRLPIGWPDQRRMPAAVDTPLERFAWLGLVPLLGWLMTALAATMGAPFWFDVLNRVMVIRSTVKPREKSPEEGSEDRKLGQRPRAPTDDAEPGGADGAANAAAGGGANAPPAQPPQPQPPQPQPLPGAATPLAALDAEGDPGDPESHIDACDLEIEDETPDEELPPAEGGVA